MAWWNKFSKQPVVDNRVVKTPRMDTKEIAQVKEISLKQLNNRDIETIKKIQDELLAAGVLAPKEESIEITDQFEDILQAAYEQGLRNVDELVRDFALNEELSSGIGGDNLLLDEIDDYEDTVYDVYEAPEKQDSVISVEANSEDGNVALRMPDGSTVYGRIPGHK